MTQINQVYKCNTCGIIVEILHEGGGNPACCGQEMELLQEKTEDIGKEKHVPIFEKTDKGIKVKVGVIPHPMEEKHYIEWIEVISTEARCRKYLKPGDKPEAVFKVAEGSIEARIYCNIHGLWKSV